MANKRQRNRKRRRSEIDDTECEEPLKKKRKLAHNNDYNIKCQSLEPKITKNPFENTTIPIASPYHRHQKRRRHSSYSAYPTHHQIVDDEDIDLDDNKDLDNDESELSELSSESNLSVTPNDYPLRFNKLQLRSQPSTPIRKINIDSNREPLSQSAKKSQRVQKRRIIAHFDNLPQPSYIQSDRKQLPNILSSQDSIQFSPPQQQQKTNQVHDEQQIHDEQQQKPKLEKTHVIVGVNSNYNNSINPNIKSFSNYNLYQIILFIFIGVIIGFIVSYTVYHQNELQHNKHILITNQCQECIKQKLILNDESNKLKQECQIIQNKIEICNIENDKLRRKIKLQGYNNNNNKMIVDDGICSRYISKINGLEHDLGECNVEWGACQQLGRQQSKLDEKRVEEIQNQKKKFSLCNEQLKRYKKAAKL